MRNALESPQTLRLFPEKLFFKIGEVSRLAGVESYVLRYWETEFSFLRPRKSKSGQRLYTKKDVELILQIKKLLYEERYTIDGVRRKFGGVSQRHVSEDAVKDTPGLETDAHAILSMVKERLRNLLKALT